MANESLNLIKRLKKKIMTSRNMAMGQRERRKCRPSELNSSSLMVGNQQIQSKARD